ncbi:MAG: Spore protein SP21 [Syntrophorhabdus sp. PtaB.Bin047]|nr:MAG: Spore protein SP21 [Syntrophorhabdus sp. PtaB.Bin047]
MTTRRIPPLAKRPQGTARLPEEYPLLSLRTNIDRLFDHFLSGFDISPFAATPSMFNPSIDVADSGRELRVTVELPGMDEKDIDVSVTQNSLTIRGEKKDETEEKGNSYHRMERVYGSFTRTIPLPVEVNVDGAKANYRKGVLSITIPKTEKALKEAKKIPIRVSGK